MTKSKATPAPTPAPEAAAAPATDPNAEAAAAREALKTEVRLEIETEWRASFDEAVKRKAEELVTAEREQLRATITQELRAEFTKQAKEYVAQAKAAQPQPAAQPKGSAVPVRYIGHRPTYKDGAYGTAIVFTKGKSEFVPADKAALMLLHKDVYEPGDARECGAAPVIDRPKTDESDDPIQMQRDAIAISGKEALAAYARIHFNTELDERRSVEDLRAQVTGLIDQYGFE